MAGAITHTELEEIRAPSDVPKVGVHGGDYGVIVEVFEAPRAAVLVEFTDDEGQTKALVTYSPDLGRVLHAVSEN